MSRTRLVLFDLDNTLYDHGHARDCGLRALQARFPELAIIPLTRLAADYDRLLTEGHRRVLDGDLTIEQARFERMRQALVGWGVRANDAAIDETARLWFDTYTTNERATPGSFDLLERLRAVGVRIGVVTNGLSDVQHRKLTVCGLDGRIDFALVSQAVGCRKPEPGIFRQALARAGAAAEETVFVGDSWEHDVLGARAVGIRPVWFNRDGASRPCGVTVDELRAFRPVEHALNVILSNGRSAPPRATR